LGDDLHEASFVAAPSNDDTVIANWSSS